MTPNVEQQRSNHNEWRNWKQWSRWEKVSTVIGMIIIISCHVFFNYILPRLVEKEDAAAKAAASRTTPGLQIPKPEISIPPNPNLRP